MRPSTYIPLILLAYLAVMAYIGRGELAHGNYLYYFGLIALTLVCILLLHLFLKRRQRRSSRQKDINEQS